MDEVCVGLGFCGCIKNGKPLHVDRFIPSSGPVRADQFAEWVFLADDMNPNSHPERWEKIRAKVEAAFVRHMGADVVDASLLRWRDDGDPVSLSLRLEPLLLKLEVWRPLSAERAVRYNCLQNIRTGEFRVLTADFVEPGRSEERSQALYFTEQVLAYDSSNSDEQEWFSSIESAIAAHDETFEN